MAVSSESSKAPKRVAAATSAAKTAKVQATVEPSADQSANPAGHGSPVKAVAAKSVSKPDDKVLFPFEVAALSDRRLAR